MQNKRTHAIAVYFYFFYFSFAFSFSKAFRRCACLPEIA